MSHIKLFLQSGAPDFQLEETEQRRGKKNCRWVTSL